MRLTDGFDIDQMVSEYRALRASVVKQWIAHNQVLQATVATTERATQILNDVLDVTLAAFGTDIPVVKAPMDMGQLGIQLVEEMRTVSGRAIEISISGETQGEWDKARIGQVLSKLIDNALQYNSEHGVVRVNVDGQESDVLISVHNDGNPIPPAKMKVIFESFTRGQHGDAAPGRAANLGIGLYITKRIVLAHQGEISVTSTVEAGTTSIVRLPRQKLSD